MKSFKAYISTSILCFIFWMLFTIPFGSGMTSNQIKQEVIVGIIVSLIVALFCYKFLIKENAFWLFHPKRILSFIVFILIFFVELVKSNLDVALRALSFKPRVNPGIVKIETPVQSQYGLSMLSNSITLTPGTITLEVEKGRNSNYLYIHWIDVKSQECPEASKNIKGSFEPWIRRIFK